MIKISEALHEKKISLIADKIKARHKGKSDIGLRSFFVRKTTFSKRLAIQLMVNGMKPVNLSLDNYFVNREFTPRDEKGNTIMSLSMPSISPPLRIIYNGY